MKIRNKVFIIMVTVLLLLISVACSITHKYLKSNLKKTEISYINSKLEINHNIIRDSLDSLTILNKDWSAWDATLNFVKFKDENYIKNNLNDSTFNDLKINLFIVLDKLNNIKYIKYYNNLSPNSTNKPPKELTDYINKNIELLCNHKTINSSINGIISVGGKPVLFSSAPITNSTYNSPISGTLIVGKYIDNSFVNKIKTITGCNITINLIKNIKDNGTYLNIDGIDFHYISEGNYKNVVSPIDNNNICGYTFIKGIDNRPLFLLNLTTDRDSYNQGVKSLKFFIFLFCLYILILFWVCNILIKMFIISPIESIGKQIKSIDLKNLKLNKIKIKSKDELGELSLNINNMLENILENNKIIYENERQLSIVMEGANAGFWDWNIEKGTLNLSTMFFNILGYKNNDISPTIKCLAKIIHKEDLKYFLNILNENLRGVRNSVTIEHRVLTNYGNYKWIFTQGNVVEYDSHGAPKRMTGIITDIDDKKRSEEQLRYLTYYDKLTGVFNRGYYEYILDKINQNKNYPITIIIGDINGLKITNDTFGHEAGDKLLMEAANILKECGGKDSWVCRWGGDEFAIIIKEADEFIGEYICKKIKAVCKTKTLNSIRVNIALGYATKYNDSEDISQIIKEAEDKMYRNKLLEDQSARNSIITSLTKSLWEKSHETEEHTLRIYNLCEKVGKKLKLSSSQLDELYTLAKLHDIGKIAIPDEILNKPDKLTEEEWSIMKTHTEIGYRIACSSQELSHIAYKILTHHEQYNGCGYPKGLKGDKIPLLSRLLSIVDSFDVMTHDRPYKKAISKEEAIKELIRCSGTQFDPNLLNICIDIFKEL